MVSELHMDGNRERKTFAPGYGEFFTSGGGDTEALALAVPADTAGGALPTPVRKLNMAATSALDAALRGDLEAIDRAAAAARRAWKSVDLGEVPRLLRPLLVRGVSRLDTAAGAGRAAQAAIDLARLAQDPAALRGHRFGRFAPLRHLARSAAARRPPRRPRRGAG